MAFAIHIDPPLAGVNRRAGFQEAPPFTAHTIEDMWPVDVDSGRALLAVRPVLNPIQAPGTTANLLQPVNGVKSDGPKQSIITASGSDLYWWDDIVWRTASGAQASAIDTGRAVFATTFLQQAFIFVDDSKPIVFDYPTGQAYTLEEFAGEAPTGCRGGFTWQGGIWAFGDETSPHVLYGSRTGSAYDWDFSADIEDEGGAVFDLGGKWSGPITAGFEQTHDTAIISAMSGIVAYGGHPRRGGVPEKISTTHILGQGAWTKLPDDTVYAMTPRGLMMIDTKRNVLPVSAKHIPDELVGIPYSFTNPTVNVAYSHRWNCVYITDRQDGGQQAWAYHIDTSAFVKMELVNYPFVMAEFLPFVSETTCGVLFGRS